MLEALQTTVLSPPTVPDIEPPIIPSSLPPQHTIPVSPKYSYPSNHDSVNQGILMDSLIAGGLIGASIIIGLSLDKSLQLAQQRTSSNQSPAALSEPQDTALPLQPNKPPEKIQTTLEPPPEPPVSPQNTGSSVPKQTPARTPISQFTPSTWPQVNRPSPQETVRIYYTTINQGQYQDAWNQVSKSFQNNQSLHPKGYSSYTNWWKNQVHHVDINQISLVEADAETAVVNAQLKYWLRNGNVISNSVRLSLLWDAENNRWLLADAQ